MNRNLFINPVGDVYTAYDLDRSVLNSEGGRKKYFEDFNSAVAIAVDHPGFTDNRISPKDPIAPGAKAFSIIYCNKSTGIMVDCTTAFGYNFLEVPWIRSTYRYFDKTGNIKNIVGKLSVDVFDIAKGDTIEIKKELLPFMKFPTFDGYEDWTWSFTGETKGGFLGFRSDKPDTDIVRGVDIRTTALLFRKVKSNPATEVMAGSSIAQTVEENSISSKPCEKYSFGKSLLKVFSR